MLRTKLNASLVHLALSFVLVSLIISLVIYFWYPLDYINITNFKEIVLLIISIDLVLGPLLTFVAFNPQKKSLRFDLAVIAVIQLSALTYGVNALYNTHPLYITYNHGRFNLIQANEVSPDMAQYDDFKISKLSSLKVAFAKMPDDPDKQVEIMLGVDLKGEPDIDKRVEYFEPHENHMDTILKGSLDIVKLFDKENLTESSKSFLENHGAYKETYAYLPLKGTSGDAVVVIDKKSAELITTINTIPWAFVKK